MSKAIRFQGKDSFVFMCCIIRFSGMILFVFREMRGKQHGNDDERHVYPTAHRPEN